MNIWLLLQGAAGLGPYLLPVEEEGMCERRRNRSKGEPV